MRSLKYHNISISLLMTFSLLNIQLHQGTGQGLTLQEAWWACCLQAPRVSWLFQRAARTKITAGDAYTAKKMKKNTGQRSNLPRRWDPKFCLLSIQHPDAAAS